MIPSVPVSVWEQISVVIVFAFLLAGLGWLWQQFTLRAFTYLLTHLTSALNSSTRQIAQSVDANTEMLAKLISEFRTHDLVTREAYALEQAHEPGAEQTRSAPRGKRAR